MLHALRSGCARCVREAASDASGPLAARPSGHLCCSTGHPAPRETGGRPKGGAREEREREVGAPGYGMMMQFSLPPSFADEGHTSFDCRFPDHIPGVVEPAVMSRITYDGLLMPDADETV